MTKLASDDFNRADGGLGANWNNLDVSPLQIVGNQVQETAAPDGNDGVASYVALAWPNDQYSRIRIVAASANRGVYPFVRSNNLAFASGIGSMYFAYIIGPLGAAATLILAKFVDHAYTELFNSGATMTINANDILEIRAVGKTISAWLNGVQKAAATDPDLAAGFAGVGIADFGAVGSANEAIFDDWEGGDFVVISSGPGLLVGSPYSFVGEAFIGDVELVPVGVGSGWVIGSPYSFIGEATVGTAEFVPGQGGENGPGLVVGSPWSFIGESLIGAAEFVPGATVGPGLVIGSPGSFVGEAAIGAPALSGQTVVLGQAVETDTAQPIAWAPKRRLINQVAETDLAQSLAHRKLKTLGQPLETDLAQALTSRKTRLLGQALETDLAQAVGRAKQKLLGLALEIDLSQPLSARKTKLLGQPAEIDLAQPVTRTGAHTVILGQPLETDLAQPIAWAPKRRLINQVAETDLAQALAHRKLKALGLALEIDLAQPLTHLKTRTLGQPLEIDLAQPIASNPRRRLISQALELDIAQAIAHRRTYHLGQAAELDFALPVTLGGFVLLVSDPRYVAESLARNFTADELARRFAAENLQRNFRAPEWPST